MKCPRCIDALAPIGTQGQAHACPRGHGHLLSSEEVARVFEPQAATTLRNAPLGSATPGVDCPACGSVMRRLDVARPQACELDACTACHAVWFERDALARLTEGTEPLRVRKDMVPPLRQYLRGYF